MPHVHKNLFSSLGQEGVKQLINRLKTDPKFCYVFFYGEENSTYSLCYVREFVTSCVNATYHYKISKQDFGTLMYEKLWDEGTWHALDTFKGKSFNSWLVTVSFHTVTAHLKQQGIIKEVKMRTASNTKVNLRKETPEGCQMILEEVMPEGKKRDLLMRIYVERENEDVIMKALKVDSNEYKKAREEAENYFKFRLVNSNYVYEDYVITDKMAGHVTMSVELADALGMFTQRESIFSDVFGVNLSPVEVESLSMEFVTHFVTYVLKWSERDIFIFTERRKGTKPEEIARQLGCRRDYVDTRYSRLTSRFEEKFRIWWYSHT